MSPLHTDKRFDRCLRRALQTVDPGHADRAVVLAAAREVSTGDLDGWVRWWRRLGIETLDQADALLDEDRLLESRERYLQACDYFGHAVAAREGGPSDPGFDEDLFHHVMAFRTAMPMLEEGCDIVEPHLLPGVSGYFCWARGSGVRPVVLAVMSSGLTAEIGCRQVAVDVVARGLDCLVLNPGAVVEAAMSWLRSRQGKADYSPGLSRLSAYVAGAATARGESGPCQTLAVITPLQEMQTGTAALRCLCEPSPAAWLRSTRASAGPR